MNATGELRGRAGFIGSALRPRVSLLAATLLMCALFFVLFAAPAHAFTVKGGTAAQRAEVATAIKACAIPSSTTDSELRAFGPVEVDLAQLTDAVAYSTMGHIYIDSDIAPGDVLTELAAHEWAHQIWYTLGPKWWQKWSELCGAGDYMAGGAWREDPAENFAECAKVALWSGLTFKRDYPVTDLKVTDPADFRDWLATARYARNCPFTDLSPNAMPSTSGEDELAAAAGYVSAAGMMQGIGQTTFGAAAPLTRGQLAQICGRAGLSYPAEWRFDATTATRGEVRDTLPGLSWQGEHWSEPLTRGQLARLLWRSR